MDKIILKQTSSLEKVFLNSDGNFPAYDKVSAFKNERVAYQIAFTKTCEEPMHHLTVRCGFNVKVESPIKDYVDLRVVGNVPSTMPVFPYEGGSDDNYMCKEIGLYPDPIFKMSSNRLYSGMNIWSSLFVLVDLKGEVPAGEYPIDLVFEIDDPQWEISTKQVQFENGETSIKKRFTVKVMDAILPEHNMLVSQWFHTDCIYKYYDIECFSERHWELIEKFIKMAVDYGLTGILTPVFTPPLDTFIGCERPTVQLVDIYRENGVYSFDFTKFDRWVDLCKKNGVIYYEMPHLFTQWGAEACPKIMVTENGETKNAFGWDVAAESEEYTEFLKVFLPALVDRIRKNGIEETTFFHISDEPEDKHLEHYLRLKDTVTPLLEGFLITDALTHYEFYKNGVIDRPIVSINNLDPFIENNVPDLFGYYCCGQFYEVSNRFFSMPSARNRIIATQLYKFNLAGFLQWGFNFYYSKGSEFLLDPFRNTDSLYSFQSGDAFSVYPDKNGPLESLRLVVFAEALQDLRAMKMLEKYIGRDGVIKLIEEHAEMEITFKKYPQSADYILSLRERINREIEERL